MKALWLQVYVPPKHAERAPTALGPKQLMCKVKFSPASSCSRAARKNNLFCCSRQRVGWISGLLVEQSSFKERERERERWLFSNNTRPICRKRPTWRSEKCEGLARYTADVSIEDAKRFSPTAIDPLQSDYLLRRFYTTGSTAEKSWPRQY